MILRSTAFSDFRINPGDFEQRHQEVAASDARMVRETEAGMRYLEKNGSGERVVKEGFDTSRVFMLGGVHHDAGLEFPVVPLGGIDYFNFDRMHRGIQTNVFFAGVIIAANATNPNVANTRTNVGADFFGIAIPTTNSIFRNGGRTEGRSGQEPAGEPVGSGRTSIRALRQDRRLVRRRPPHLSAIRGHGAWLRGSVGYVRALAFHRAAVRAVGLHAHRLLRLQPPHLVGTVGQSGRVQPESEDVHPLRRVLRKAFYLPRFQRIGLDLNYLDGQRLDRFSKYELGFFGTQRIHGIKSGSVRAEKAIIGHLSYGFVFSDQFRLEAFYDHGLLDDTAAGYHREPFQGVGIAGQTVGPYGTLMRLDIGSTIGRNRQGGFVANVVLLKLF